MLKERYAKNLGFWPGAYWESQEYRQHQNSDIAFEIQSGKPALYDNDQAWPRAD